MILGFIAHIYWILKQNLDLDMRQKMTHIEGLKWKMTQVWILNDVCRGLVSITERRKTELTHIEARYIEDSLYTETRL